MKKFLITFFIVGLILLIGVSTSVYAVDVVSITATPSKNTIKAGEELKVVLSLTKYNDKTIAAITSLATKIDYDSNVFEDVTQNDISSDFLAIYNDNDDTHELNIASSTGIIEGSELATITFRAKSNITSTSSIIAFKGIKADNNDIADIPLTISIGAEEIPGTTVATLEKIEVSKKPTKQAYKIGEKFDATGMEITATYSDNTTKVITNYTFEPSGELKEEDKKITITYKEGEITKTTEQKIYVNETGELPKTGMENYLAPAMVAILGIAIVSLIKTKKYNNV